MTRQFFVFLVVGLLSAAVDVGVMTLLIYLKSPYQLATSVGFVTGLLFNYLTHSQVTFKSELTAGSMIRYIAIVILNYILTLGFVAASVHLMENPLIGKIASLPIVAILGYLFGRSWIFRQGAQRTGQ
jgi:putative flippase GtrA